MFMFLSFIGMLFYILLTGLTVNFSIQLLYFFPITFISHTITDYFTSRIVSKRFKDGHLGSAIPNLGAFTVIGFDQVLHYIQLFTTFLLLK